MILKRERLEVLEYCRKMLDSNLTTGTWGNISLRDPESRLIAVTPSGMQYESLKPKDIVVMDLTGKIIDGNRKPSVETVMHLRIFEKNPECNGIVHTHSFYATVLSVIGVEIPTLTAEIGSIIGHDVPVVPFALCGSEELAELVAEYIIGRRAVLMANHGAVSIGKDLENAFNISLVVEEAAKLYWAALAVAPEKIKPLSNARVQELKTFYETKYGQK